MNFLINIILDLLFPRRCPVCGQIVMPKGSLICLGCVKKLSWVRGPVCKCCGKEIISGTMEYCPDCAAHPRSFSHGMALPAMMMIYLKTGGIPSPSSPFILGQVLANHGWTWRTALCTCLMALTRFPSITVCLKMRRSPGHTPYFFWGRLLVFILGITLCFLIALTGRISG